MVVREIFSFFFLFFTLVCCFACVRVVLEGKNIIPPDRQSGADPYMVLYLMKNKKKIRPSRKDFTKFEGAKYTLFAIVSFFSFLIG